MLTDLNNKNIYEEFHKDNKLQKRIISRKNFTYRNLIDVIEKNLKKNSCKNVLDLGCGTGTMSFYLSSLGLKVVGINISEKAIETCDKNKQRFCEGKNISFFRINFPSEGVKGEFDLIICFEVLEHIKEESEAIRNIKKILSPEGIAIFSVPSSNSLLYRFEVVKKFDRKVGHIRRYSILEIEIKMRNAKMELLNVIESEGVFRNFLFFVNFPLNSLLIKLANRLSLLSNFLTFIDNIFLRIFGSSQIIFVAKRKL